MKPYAFEDIIASLDTVAKLDWKPFFDERVKSTAKHAPLGGLERTGWRLVYRDTPSKLHRQYDEL